MMAFISLLSRLPLSALYVLSDILYWVSYRVIRYRKQIIRENLTKSFPEKSEREIKAIQKDFYRRFCDHAVETIKLLTISEKELKKRMVLINAGFIEQYRKHKQSLICFSSHQFNWEWLLGAASLILPVPVRFVYQSQQSHFADRLLLKARTHFRAQAIERKRVGREVIRGKNGMEIVSIVADQFPGHANDKKYWTHFLNQKTAFFKGVSELAQMLEYPVAYTKIRRIRRGYYQSTFVKIGEPPYDQSNEVILENYARELEQTIREDAPGWLWSHNRWKHR